MQAYGFTRRNAVTWKHIEMGPSIKYVRASVGREGGGGSILDTFPFHITCKKG